MISICRKFTFEAAHHLPFYQGPCKNPHGHSYKLEIEITGEIKREGSNTGMIIDFGELKDIVQEDVLSVLDHQDLNLIYPNPTAEMMIESIALKIKRKLQWYPGFFNLLRVRLWETENCYAEWKEGRQHEN